jgi:hypothetical protein
MRLLRLIALRLRFIDEGIIVDGFGSCWPMYCWHCGREIQIVRPGKAQCPGGHDLWIS